MQGKVRWFNSNRGYGFINRLNEDGDIFIHFSQIKEDGFRHLLEGELVEFEIKETERGLQAHNVSRLPK